MDYGFDKHKLPKGMSYPLKRSALDAALKGNGISQVHVVYYWLRQSGHNVMRADYLGESKKGWATAGQSSITLYAVPSDERKQTENLILSEALPRLCEWLKKIEVGGNSSRFKDQHLVIECSENKLFFREF
ncbi:MAG: hypothetical protein JSS81_04770 [Acidobacteria bacterium]|nr:hypothetical protein [Acidobacteriota bacterium]